MLLVASLSVGYESITNLLASFLGTASGIDFPELVIMVDSVALATAGFLFFYQRMVRRATGSLTLSANMWTLEIISMCLWQLLPVFYFQFLA